jgi:hypothetical protein
MRGYQLRPYVLPRRQGQHIRTEEDTSSPSHDEADPPPGC